MPATPDAVRDLLFDTKALSEQIKSLAIYTEDFQVEVDPRQPTKLNRQHFDLIVDDAQRVAHRSLRAAEWLAIAASKSISDEIVEDLKAKVREKAESIKERYNEKDLPLHEVAKANDMDRRELCLFIHEIRKNSGGKLPKDLDDDWRDQMCSTYKFR